MEIIIAFFQLYLNWVYNNVGNGDGTQHIREIWKDDPYMADHLVKK